MHRVALTLRVLASGVLLALAGLALTLTVLAAPPLLAGASFQEPLAYSCHQLPGAPVEERIDVEARWSWWPAGITCTAHEDNGPRVFAAPDWSSATGVYVGTTVILAVEVLCAVGLVALFWPRRTAPD